jgi:hypothetical protein
MFASNENDERFALRTDLRQGMPAVATGIPTICTWSHESKKRRKGKRNADKRCSTTSAPSGAARALQGALAHRRSTAVLAKGSHRPQGSASGQASWDVV